MEFDYASIINLANSCLFTEEEKKNNIYYIKNLITTTGFTLTARFNKEKIEEHKEEIIELLNQIPGLEDGISILKVPYSEAGQERASVFACEVLMCLGLACGEIEYTHPRQAWNSLPGGFPMIKRKQASPKLELVK